MGKGITTIKTSAFSGCTNVYRIVSKRESAPSGSGYPFGNGGNTTGYNNRTKDINILYVPAGATGYESTYWTTTSTAAGNLGAVNFRKVEVADIDDLKFIND